MNASVRALLVSSAALVTLLLSAEALADKVAVLPFSASTSASTKQDLDGARTAAQRAVLERGHALPTESEMTTAETAVKDGVADTSEEYRAAGRASGSDWTVSGRVDAHGKTYRLELEACQVSTGRVESLAREIDPAQGDAQISEMFALLLRPEGIANADIPWERAQPKPATPPPAPPVVTTPPPPAGPPPAPHTYAEGHPIALGVGGVGTTAVARAKNAQGSPASAIVAGAFGYALPSVLPGVELRADLGAAVAGPQSLFVDAGARYAFMLAPSSTRLYAGPEATLGAFFTRGGDKETRFLAHGALFVGTGIADIVQVEAFGDLMAAPGGSASLVLLGGGGRVFVRF